MHRPGSLALTHYDSLYIGSQWLPVPRSALEPVLNPATEQVIGAAPVGGKAECEMAVRAARQAFDSGPWPRMAAPLRIAKLRSFCDFLRDRKTDITNLIVAETGICISLAATLAFDSAMQIAEATLALGARDPVSRLPMEIHPAAGGKQFLGTGVVVREPVGVVAVITPYNFPFLTSLVKAMQALVVGNTVVVKPSPYTPFEALLLGDAAQAAGLPPGVLNVVTGGTEAGQVLTTDKQVDMVNFTGSDVVGSAIQAQSAQSLKRLILELGGKSALLVCEDADIQAAAEAGALNIILHAGQACGLNTRHIVHNSIRRQFVESMTENLKKLKVGDPTDTAVAMGPLIREVQRAKVESYVDIGRQEGARLVIGGGRPKDFDRGFFFEATLFDGVSNTSRIAREEVFGPVGVVIGVDSDEEAVAIANDSEYGLSGAIYSSNVGRAFELARQIRTGSVAINGGTGAFSPHAPFGGVKRSGYGREYGIEGLNEYTYAKSILFHAG